VAFLSIESLLEDLGVFSLREIHWVIVGGESGPGARPLDAAWVRSVRALCRGAQVPFFLKQWGGVRKKKHGRTLDGRIYDEYPEQVSEPMPTAGEGLELLETLAVSSKPCSYYHA